MSGSASRGSRARVAARRRSRSGWSAWIWRWAVASGSRARSSSPATARWCASGPPRSRCTCCCVCSMADTLRLFVALELPAVARSALGAFRDRAEPEVWRPVGDEALHLTLAFLGHRPESDVSGVSDLLHRLVLGHVPLALGPG